MRQPGPERIDDLAPRRQPALLVGRVRIEQHPHAHAPQRLQARAERRMAGELGLAVRHHHDPDAVADHLAEQAHGEVIRVAVGELVHVLNVSGHANTTAAGGTDAPVPGIRCTDRTGLASQPLQLGGIDEPDAVACVEKTTTRHPAAWHAATSAGMPSGAGAPLITRYSTPPSSSTGPDLPGCLASRIGRSSRSRPGHHGPGHHRTVTGLWLCTLRVLLDKLDEAGRGARKLVAATTHTFLVAIATPTDILTPDKIRAYPMARRGDLRVLLAGRAEIAY